METIKVIMVPNRSRRRLERDENSPARCSATPLQWHMLLDSAFQVNVTLGGVWGLKWPQKALQITTARGTTPEKDLKFCTPYLQLSVSGVVCMQA